MTRVVAFVALAALVLGGEDEAPPCLVAPVTGPVVEEFVAPACPFCAGHRGIEYATAPGDEVASASSGTVAFAGTVAGVRWVVVDDLPGRKVSYGSLRTFRVVAGQRIEAGETLGTAGERLYLGVRQGEEPVDPTPLLASTRSFSRARLVPTDGSPGRPAPALGTTCATSPNGR